MLCMALATPNGRTFSRSGFVQFSNYCLPSNFPDLEKDWKMEIKSGQMVKRIEFFFFFQSYNKCFRSEFLFFILVKSYSISPVCLQRTWKKLCFFVFKVSINHLFDNLESEKRNNCFGKKSGKRLGFWIQKSARTLVDRLLEVRLSLWIPLNSYPSKRTNFLNNLSKSQVFVAHNFWVICRNV